MSFALCLGEGHFCAFMVFTVTVWFMGSLFSGGRLRALKFRVGLVRVKMARVVERRGRWRDLFVSLFGFFTVAVVGSVLFSGVPDFETFLGSGVDFGSRLTDLLLGVMGSVALIKFFVWVFWSRNAVAAGNQTGQVKELLGVYWQFKVLSEDPRFKDDVEVQALRAKVASLVDDSLVEVELFTNRYSKIMNPAFEGMVPSELSVLEQRLKVSLSERTDAVRGLCVEMKGLIKSLDSLTLEEALVVLTPELNDAVLRSEESLGELKASSSFFSQRVEGIKEASVELGKKLSS